MNDVVTIIVFKTRFLFPESTRVLADDIEAWLKENLPEGDAELIRSNVFTEILIHTEPSAVAFKLRWADVLREEARRRFRVQKEERPQWS